MLAYQSLAASQVVIDANVLLALENCKTGLEELITETSVHLEQIAKLAFPSSLGYDLGHSVTSLAVPPAMIEEMNLLRWQREASSRIITVVPGPDTTGWFGDTTSLMGEVGHTLWPLADDLIDCQMFLLLRKISEYQELLGLVVTAIATLFSRLQSTVISHAIAVCQRSFFTHHGTHPPDNRSQRHSGPFSGRVFQPQVAA